MKISLKNIFQHRKWGGKRGHEINPDEILIDSSNICEFDTGRFEGRLEKPISRLTLYIVALTFFLISTLFVIQAVKMQIVNGAEYLSKSQNNILRPVPIFPGRGVIYDRNGVMLAWNAPNIDSEDGVAKRRYATSTGLSHILGYVQYPSKDKNGFYYREDFEGVVGAEKNYDSILKGVSGSRLIEVDARGNIVSGNIVRPPTTGGNITLSIDSRVQSALYENIKDIANRVGFAGGAGVIMDVTNGEVLALASYPEYSSQIMSDKVDQDEVRSLLSSQTLPFLNRATDGLYTPGSIVKPYMALGVLNEGVIESDTVIVTTGSISIPNPYDSTKSTLFRDWKNHGSIDMRHAIAVSSDAYFYIVGGGYKDQKGIGILNIDKYLQMFGFGLKTLDGSDSVLMGKAGTIPTPEWKKKTFNEDWYVGDTYHTVIGQYGFQVTPIQIVRAVAALANNGTIITPNLVKGADMHVEAQVDIPRKYFDIIHDGMSLATEIGTAKALDVDYVKIAGKSGTAELGVTKENVNSWITGFWPIENPKYAFVVMLEKGSVHNLIGAAAAMRQQLDWMNVNTPEYWNN
ncbi:MAG: penicillin-binding transpeptidase domain-containing protein [Candidatus Paceibacterota bacterium]|jgi:penicillin-binding protein 2